LNVLQECQLSNAIGEDLAANWLASQLCANLTRWDLKVTLKAE
jgi:hypothetical protein